MEASSCSRRAKQGRSSGFCQRQSIREFIRRNYAVEHARAMSSPPSSTTPWAGRRHPGPSVASGAWGLCSGPPSPRCWCCSHKGGGPRCTPPTWAHLHGSEQPLERCQGGLQACEGTKRCSVCLTINNDRSINNPDCSLSHLVVRIICLFSSLSL